MPWSAAAGTTVAKVAAARGGHRCALLAALWRDGERVRDGTLDAALDSLLRERGLW